MEAKLTFNLPDEQMEFNRATQSLDMACALFDMLQIGKSLERRFENLKDSERTDGVYFGVESMVQEINDVFEKNNIIIDNLIE